MRVGSENVPGVDTPCEHIGHILGSRWRGTQQVVALQLTDLTAVLQSGLRCYLQKDKLDVSLQIL